MVRAGIATLGLAGAVYAAEQAAAPEAEDLQGTIRAQRINEGQMARPMAPSEHQLEAFTPEQMVELAAKYGGEMKAAAEHADNQRIIAYRSRDLIRMTCIDEKLSQMTTVIKLAEPRLLSFGKGEQELLLQREHFSIISQARDRVAELTSELELCAGDFAVVPGGRIHEEATPETDNVFDPTRPPAPGQQVDRPPEASPYH